LARPAKAKGGWRKRGVEKSGGFGNGRHGEWGKKSVFSLNRKKWTLNGAAF